MTKWIRLLGHDAAIAHGGPEAIVPARDCRPEHAHLAIGLPGMDGSERGRLPAPTNGRVAARRKKTGMAKVTGDKDPCRLVRQVKEFGG